MGRLDILLNSSDERGSTLQEAFDEAVATNIQDFDMPEDEAIASAVEEFQLQGLDLSGVARRGPSTKSNNPLIGATAQLRTALSDNRENLEATLTAIRNSIAGQKEDALTSSLAVAGEEGTTLLVLEALATKDVPSSTQLVGLQALKVLLGSQKTRSHFGSAPEAPRMIVTCIQDPKGGEGLVQAAAEVVEAAATADEDNKTAFMDAGIGAAFTATLKTVPPAAVRATGRAVRRLTTADDSRPTVSRAFQNSKALAKDGLHLAFLEALAAGESGADTAAACCQAVRKLAANEEICTEVAEAGGVEAALQVLRTKPESAACAAAAAGLLRQLAGSDAVKSQIVDCGGLQALTTTLQSHANSPAALEQALGLATAVTLRAPAIADAAIAAGIPAAVLEVMGSVQQQWVQRQGCMALRNLVARNLDARPLLLDMGAETALRAAKAKFPEACGDVGSAALRDLGLADYK